MAKLQVEKEKQKPFTISDIFSNEKKVGIPYISDGNGWKDEVYGQNPFL